MTASCISKQDYALTNCYIEALKIDSHWYQSHPMIYWLWVIFFTVQRPLVPSCLDEVMEARAPHSLMPLFIMITIIFFTRTIQTQLQPWHSIIIIVIVGLPRVGVHAEVNNCSNVGGTYIFNLYLQVYLQLVGLVPADTGSLFEGPTDKEKIDLQGQVMMEEIRVVTQETIKNLKVYDRELLQDRKGFRMQRKDVLGMKSKILNCFGEAAHSPMMKAIVKVTVLWSREIFFNDLSLARDKNRHRGHLRVRRLGTASEDSGGKKSGLPLIIKLWLTKDFQDLPGGISSKLMNFDVFLKLAALSSIVVRQEYILWWVPILKNHPKQSCKFEVT
ncbi:hypothetical protein C8J56DRAFT_887912 [Mycena floridula]|nr:hypothetical protein C8J56DRAFT_887912 [Mycena floridula]